METYIDNSHLNACRIFYCLQFDKRVKFIPQIRYKTTFNSCLPDISQVCQIFYTCGNKYYKKHVKAKEIAYSDFIPDYATG